MGIVSNVKGFVKNKISSTAKKVANGIAKVSKYSPEQIVEIQEKREKYLSEIPDMTGDGAQQVIQKCMGAIGIEVYQAYLEKLNTIYQPLDIDYSSFNEDNRIRFFDITKWVIDTKEKSLDKLINVYHVLSEEDCNIALIYHRTAKDCTVTLGVVNTNDENTDPSIADKYYLRLKNAIKGNFPGAEINEFEEYDKKNKISFGIPSCLKNIKSNDEVLQHSKSIAVVSNVASDKSQDFISQSIEKLLDGMVPSEESNGKDDYTIVLLARPTKEQAEAKNRLYELYTSLSPYASWSNGFTYSENDTVSSQANGGLNAGVGGGINNGSSESDSTNKASGGAIAGNVISATSSALVFVPGWGPVAAIAGGMVGGLISVACGSKGHTVGTSQGTSFTANFGANFSRSSGNMTNIGKNQSVTHNHTNYGVKHTLDLIEAQLKRIEESSALGLWEFSAYVISDNPVVVNNVAHMYLALTQGEQSYLTKSTVNLWDGDIDVDEADTMISSVQRLQHPMFGLKNDLSDDWLMYPTVVNATTPMSGKELARSLNFPKKSLPGLPVFECAEFGRNITSYDLVDDKKEKINIGNIYHMHHEEKNVSVELLNESLASHTFITGSTGSGKSNTVYEILNEACEKNIKFLVIEPTKGEYKNIFGSREDVNVFGTNPEFTKLLRINPFSFPKGIHVFEHMDRLVEIFNVCWPMYAAMPAVLKNAIEKSYEDCGWDLTKSTNEYGDSMYPTFKDVARNIKQIIDSSEYDNENKGAYKGSLLTRLQSLTNGINGLVFTSKNETPLEKLFDNNAIVDISRVGSNETKSLLMGMLVLKLQEYRIVNHNENNEKIHHLTVIEEAHNLLKRTSTEQPVEGGNLLGKSVEMISNAIAEMRTYGEGFIIVDQAPGLLDMAAIRNTNTKIIMRLPDEMDRKLVGKAANLNDDQIIELAKLPKGVAAIYQNEWIQPVLCKIKKYGNNGSKFIEKEDIQEESKNIDDIIDIATLLSNGTKIAKTKEKEIKEKLLGLKLDASVRVAIIDSLRNPPTEPRMTKLAPIMNALFPEVTNSFAKIYKETDDKIEWTRCAERALQDIINKDIEDQVRRDIIQASITYYLYNVMSNELVLKQWINDGGLR